MSIKKMTAESKKETEEAFEEFLSDNEWVYFKTSKHDYREVWLAATESAEKRINKIEEKIKSEIWRTAYNTGFSDSNKWDNSKLAELCSLKARVKNLGLVIDAQIEGNQLAAERSTSDYTKGFSQGVVAGLNLAREAIKEKE